MTIVSFCFCFIVFLQLVVQRFNSVLLLDVFTVWRPAAIAFTSASYEFFLIFAPLTAATTITLTSASARRISDKHGVQLKLCATPSPLALINGNISIADCMPLYVAYSKLLCRYEWRCVWGEKICPWCISTIMQNFTPIGGTLRQGICSRTHFYIPYHVLLHA